MPEFLSNIVIDAVPVSLSHAARLQDVYDIVGSRVKEPVRAASTDNMPGVYSALVLTAAANGALGIDGITINAGDRVLLAGQADAKQNGVYSATVIGNVSTKWVLTRATDFDSTGELFTGLKIHVAQGLTHGDSTFVLTTDAPVLDTSDLVFATDNTSKLELVREYVGTITGTAGNPTTAYVFQHDWSTRNVTVEVIDATTYATVYLDVVRTSVNAVTVTFGSPPLLGEDYMVILRAKV
jgi:hypothetical protein